MNCELVCKEWIGKSCHSSNFVWHACVPSKLVNKVMWPMAKTSERPSCMTLFEKKAYVNTFKKSNSAISVLPAFPIWTSKNGTPLREKAFYFKIKSYFWMMPLLVKKSLLIRVYYVCVFNVLMATSRERASKTRK